MTLTELAYYIRKAFPLTVLFFILIFIFYTIYKIAELSAPPAQIVALPTPTPAFGLISVPKFENIPKAPASKEYFLDTISGVPETATMSAQIAFVPQMTANFGFKEKAAILAKALGFDELTQEVKLSDKLYTIVDKEMRLEFEIDTFNYTFTKNITADNRSIFENVVMPPEDLIRSRALDLVRDLNRYPSEVAQSSQTITYFSYKESAGAPSVAQVVKNPSEANMVEVDFFPPKYNGYDSVSMKYFTSPNYVVFVPQKNGKDFVMRAQIKVYEPSKEQTSIYPLISGDEAYTELVEGRALLISGNIDTLQKVNISKMVLAYLYPDNYSPFLTPFYVFTGENGFVSYVPAVSPLWMQK